MELWNFGWEEISSHSKGMGRFLIPGCSRSCPAWPWTLPQLFWEFCARPFPLSHGLFLPSTWTTPGITVAPATTFPDLFFPLANTIPGSGESRDVSPWDSCHFLCLSLDLEWISLDLVDLEPPKHIQHLFGWRSERDIGIWLEKFPFGNCPLLSGKRSRGLVMQSPEKDNSSGNSCRIPSWSSSSGGIPIPGGISRVASSALGIPGFGHSQGFFQPE